jgi:hypothetical protein
MNRSHQTRLIYAVLRSLHPEVAAGDLLRIAAMILEAEEDGFDEFDSRKGSHYFSHSMPVDLVLRDGGWSNLYADKRTNYCLWDEEPDAADTTADRLQSLLGKVEWPKIIKME